MNYFNKSPKDNEVGGGFSPPEGGNNVSKPLYHFDPSGLERAARAAEKLKNDPNAGKSIEMAMFDMNTRRLEILAHQKEYEYKLEVAKADSIKQQHQQTIDYLKEESKNHKIKAEYEDFLARKRNQDRLELEKKSQAELMAVQEDSVKKQEELRRSTIEYEFKLRRESDAASVAAYWKNKTNYKLGTRELELEKMRLKFDQKMKHSSLMFNSFGNMAKNAFSFFYDNKNQFLYLVAGTTLLVGCVALTRRGINIAARDLETRLFTPKLVRESGKSKGSLDGAKLEEQGLIFNPDTKNLLKEIIVSTKNTIEDNTFFRNYLFYGPPGTGKTLFAKELARNANMNYAIITGGDVVPLKENAVTELYKVMDWARGKKNILLFLDEADAFLKKRDQVEIGENMRSALNAFLYKTGEPSKTLMLVLATNRPEQLDVAVTDRVDMMINFTVPNDETRFRLIQYYYDLYNVAINNQDRKTILDSCIKEIVSQTNGLSAREISKMCTLFHVTAASAKDQFKPDMLISDAKRMADQCLRKQQWQQINKTHD